MATDFREKFNSLLKKAELSEFEFCAQSLECVTERLAECSKKFNLTAITDPDEVLTKHLIDCLITAKKIKSLAGDMLSEKSLIDVGSGAGFPSLPIAAALRDLKVVAVDSTAKKVNYINDTAAFAGIDNIRAISARAEDFCRDGNREKFDFATGRAVAALPVLCELCMPFVKVGGFFVAMKGAAALEEDEAAKSAVKKLGFEKTEILPYSLPGLDDKRFLIIYRKVSKTSDEFPRNFSRISKKPL